jgi:hypothetical protein
MLKHFPASGYSQKHMTSPAPLVRQLSFQSSALASHHQAKQSHQRREILRRAPPLTGARPSKRCRPWDSFPPEAEVINR